MLIPSFISKCVAFIGAPSGRIGKQRDLLMGTCFFLQRRSARSILNPMYFVTARHVIRDTSDSCDGTVFIRANTGGGATWMETKKSDWITGDSNIDVAVMPITAIPGSIQFACIPGQAL